MELFRWLRGLQLWATGDWQLHHDNTSAHASRLLQSFLAKHQITQMTQSLYSPDLAPCDFWLFPKLKSPLKGKRFQTVNEIQENMMGQLMAIWRTVRGPKVPTLTGTEVPLSYAQCFLYLVSSSINISIFHSIWLDTFLTDLVNKKIWKNVYGHSKTVFFQYIHTLCGFSLAYLDFQHHDSWALGPWLRTLMNASAALPWQSIW